MSWVVEEWKEGLPTKTLQKIQELESHVDKLKKERQQRQLQLESLEAAIQKQKQKVESEKGEVTALKRENQSLIELCDNQEKTRQKLTHEQQVKDTQINFLEGQLSASKKHIEKLEQELKRHKNDVERSQQSFNAGDMSVCVTPQKSVTVSFTPIKYNDCKYEELQEKYNNEVEERKRLETELKILQIKMVSQSSQPTSQNTMNHRDIARHQSSSSVFSWQQERTPSRASSSSHDTSLKRSFPSTQCPWEQEETPSKRGFKPDNCNRSFSDSYNNSANDQLKNQNQELRSKINELEVRLQVQDKELKNQLNKLQETRTLLEKSQTELVEKDKALSKSRDEFARVTTQFEQSADKCAQTEQKLKKVSEELSCQRQNAESARMAVEHKLKEREKENQQELLRQQNSLKNIEQQLNQMQIKLSQESQQAKNEFNAIQSELDRVTHGKKILESEVEEMKQKLLRAEQALYASESHGNDFKRNLEEAKSRENAIKSQLDQKSKEASKLEEEFRTANQTIRQNQLFMDELTNKNNSLEVELKSALQKLQGQDSTNLQNLNVAMTNLEKERDCAQELLKKRERDMNETKNVLAEMVAESQALKSQLDCKEKECKDLISANNSLSIWKTEHENVTNTLFREKEEMSARTKDLESANQTHMDQMNLLEHEKKNLLAQIKALQDIVDAKMADLDVQKVTSVDLQRQLETESQKRQKETENLIKKISDLETELKLQELSGSSTQMSYLESELENQKKVNTELKIQHEKLLESQLDVQKKLLQVEVMHEQFVSDSRSQVESFQDNLSAKQNSVDSLVSVIKQKDEEISMVSEKVRLANADLQSVHQSNKELNDKLQEINLLSESWSTERETLTALISSKQQDIEKLTAELNSAEECRNILNHENTQVQHADADLNHTIEKRDTDDSNYMEEEGPEDGCSEEIKKKSENLKQEIAECTENLCRTQKENNRLLGVNRELSTLVGKLQNSELSLNNVIDDLRVCLKEKETSLINIQASFKKLKRDYEEKQIPAENLYELFNNPQSASKYGVDSENDINLAKKPLGNSESPIQKDKTIPCSIDKILTIEDCDEISVNNNDTIPLVDLTEDVSSFTFSMEPQNPCENETLLINLDQLTLTTGSDSTITLPDLRQLQSQQSTTLSSFSSPASKEESDGIRCGMQGNRKSTGNELVDLLLQQTPERQHVLFSGMKNENSCDLKDLLTFYQMEQSKLQNQHLAEDPIMQQKLKDQVSELETELAAEKARAECLSRELDAARLELQVLDLSARSLLSFDSDDLSTRLDTTNQSICTFLPIGRLSLDQTELLSSENLKLGQQSPEVKIADGTIDLKTCGHKNLLEEKGDVENSFREKKRRKDSTSEVHVDNSEIQIDSELLQLKTPESFSENQKLFQLINEREQVNQALVLEVKDLSAQIEQQRAELTGKETEKQELGSQFVELQKERLQLLEKIELICNEKLQSACRIVDLEKEIHNSVTTVEALKVQMFELSGIQEALERSNREWKENCLQTESELRRVKSEKANIEEHALSLEADLDVLQSKYQRLQEESDGSLRSFNDLQENLDVVLAQKYQISLELENLVEEKEDLEQMYKKLKERETELESSKLSSKELIKILEADIRALKEELQAAKSATEQLIAEQHHTAGLQDEEKIQIEELQKRVQQIQEEKNILLTEQEALQTRLSTAHGEHHKLSSALECCQVEKHELASRLNSAQGEVTLMRTGIEKLKVKIESDERKKHHTIEKLKEGERKFDSLNDRIDTLERELVMTEENLENAILQTETATEEAERLNSQKENLEIELNGLRRKFMSLEKEYESSQEKIVQLEATIESLTNSLERREVEHTLFRDNSEEQRELLQTQLEELGEQKVLSDRRYDCAVAEHADITAEMEQHKAQLLQQLEEAKILNSDLTMSVEKLTLELGECKLQLSEKIPQLVALESLSKDVEQWETKYSSEMSRFEVEREGLENENKSLQTALEELEAKVQTISEGNDSFQATIAGLKTSCDDLEAQLESAKSEKQVLLEEVAELEENRSSLQSKLQDADLQIKAIEEQNSGDRQRLDEEMQTMRRQHEESSALLLAATSDSAEKENTLTGLQRELESQAQKHKEDIMEYKSRLLQADSRHQSLLDEVMKQVAELEENRSSLQSRLQDADLQIKTIEEQNSGDRQHLDEEMQTMRRQHEESSALLLAATSDSAEKENTLTGLQRELESQAQKHKEDIMEYNTRLLQADSRHQSLLDEVMKQVAELEENRSSLQSRLQDADLQIKTIEEQNSGERQRLDEEMQTMRRQHEESSALLLAATSDSAEKENTLTGLQRELESQAQKHKEDIMEYNTRLLQADSHHQSLLDEVMKQHKGDIDGYREKLTAVETHLNAHKLEIDCLKASNGELSESLCKAQEQLGELKRLKGDLEQVKRENTKTCRNLHHWINSCKELKRENQRLQQRISQQEETDKGLMQTRENTNMNTSSNDSLSEMEELKQCLEEKTQEADECAEKYCNLLFKTHKLEDENDALRQQVDFLSSRLKESKTEVNSPSLDNSVNKRRGRKSRRSTQGPGKQSNKRQRECDDTGSNPTTPQCVTKRVKKTGARSSEQETFVPEGLPEVVKKGFADIPSGKRSPFILRRTAVPLRKSPRLNSQTNSPSVPSTQIEDLENLSDFSSPTPGGSKSQMTKAMDASQLGSDLAQMHVSSPLSAHNKLRSQTAGNPCAAKAEEHRPSVTMSHDQSEEEGTCHVQ
ncbi:centromere protein F [Mixophyes fleayi]|uniref:centromere protein F n=1 Tax=Mixophyes fleayi TaxID=3061075 RepID=UPI003F4DA7D9